MSRFLLMYVGIYGGTHVYLYLWARRALGFGPKGGTSLALGMLLMVLAPMIVRYTEGAGHEGLARGAAFLGYEWMGLALLMLACLMVADLGRLLVWTMDRLWKPCLRMPGARTIFLGALGLSVALMIYGHFEARAIRIERHEIRTPKLAAGHGPLRIVQISDVHLGLLVGRDRLARIVEAVKAEAPDILVSTGDLVDGQVDGLEGLIGMLGEIEPRYGKYAVFGNHEYYAGERTSRVFTLNAGFRLLRDEAVTHDGLINIVGAEDSPHGERPSHGYDKLLYSINPETFTLLLKHRPVVSYGSLCKFDLQLSGHTHRGQLFPFALPVWAAFPYISGMYDLGDGCGRLYVSRGTGTWGPPVRIFSPPEVTVLDIIPDGPGY